MDFNLDDPLGDLLSDGSNDSFFETTKKKAVVAVEQPPNVAESKKSRVESLFGGSKDEESVRKPVPQKSIPPISPVTKRSEHAVQQDDSFKPVTRTPKQLGRKEITFTDDSDDLFADLGFDPKKPKGVGVKKSNILDDLLGKTPPSRPSTSGAAVSRQSTFEKIEPTEEPISGGYAPSSRPRTSSIKRRSSIVAPNNDPLGFFAPEPKKQESKPVSKTADWLGLTTKDTQPIVEQAPQTIVTAQTTTLPHPPPTNLFQPIANLANQTENSLQNLNQQETQLMVAAQMKSQELRLMEMQRKQQDLLTQQEHHFSELLNKQMRRQTALEESIVAQQDRINSHIQILMAQPVAVFDSKGSEEKAELKEQNAEKEVVDIGLRAEIKQLELEKLRLDDLLQNIKTNHDMEMDLMEQSHKKQIALLEDNLVKLENRLQSENVSLEDFYTKKVAALELEKVNLTLAHAAKLLEVEQNYENVVKKINEQHTEQLLQIRNDHRDMIENIRQSKLLEFSLVQESTSYLQTLRNASSSLENASEDLQNIRVDLSEKIDRIHQERELRLATREKKCEAEQNQFEKLRESTETERLHLLELVRSLDVKLNELTQSSAEEQWSMRQQRATLEAERVSFEHERAYAREKHSRDEKRIEELKNRQIDEQKRLFAQISEDRAIVLAEKSKIETMSRLNYRPEQTVESSRVEIDAAVKVAQDAARQADVERDRLMDMQRKYEIKKRQLIDQESAIRAKETELEMAITAAEKNAELATKSTKQFQEKFASKHQKLHEYSQQLIERETKLSHEKYEISRERLQLQALRKQLYESRCSLCKIGERSKEISELLTQTDDHRLHEQQQSVGHVGQLSIQHDVSQDIAAKFDDLLDIETEHSIQKMNAFKSFEVDLSAEGPNFGNTAAANDSFFVDPELIMHNLDAMLNSTDNRLSN